MPLTLFAVPTKRIARLESTVGAECARPVQGYVLAKNLPRLTNYLNPIILDNFLGADSASTECAKPRESN